MRDIRANGEVRALIGAGKPRELHGDNPLRRHTDKHRGARWVLNGRGNDE